MIGTFKQITAVAMSVSIAAGALGNSEQAVRDLDWYANAKQDVISYHDEDTSLPIVDLFSNEAASVIDHENDDYERKLCVNGESTTLEQLAEQLKNADAVVFNVLDRGTTDVFTANIVQTLIVIGELGISDDLISLNLEYRPKSVPADCDVIRIAPDGALSFAGKTIELSDLPDLISENRKVGIESDPNQLPPAFSDVLNVVKAVEAQNIHHILIADRRQIVVSAEIYQLSTDGTRKTLAAPRVTTMSGYSATIRVVENASGQMPYKAELDQFHQEDLANLGIRFSVKPQFIAEYIRLSGVAVLTKASDLNMAFKAVDVPVHSYTVSKTVVPFSMVLNSVSDEADFPVAEVGGSKTRCRLTVVIVDEKGMSQADRDRARAAAHTLSTQKGPPESRSK